MEMKIVLALTILVFSVSMLSAEKILRYMPTEYKLWSDNVVVNYSFSIDEKVPYVNITVKVLKDIKTVDMHFEGQIIGKKDTSHYFNFNTTFSFCNMLNWKSASPLGTVAFAYLKEYGNLPDTCPIPKGEYRLHRVWFPEDPITSTLPEVDFNFNVQSFVSTVDGAEVNKLVLNDFWKGEALVRDIPSIKKNMLSFIPKMNLMG